MRENIAKRYCEGLNPSCIVLPEEDLPHLSSAKDGIYFILSKRSGTSILSLNVISKAVLRSGKSVNLAIFDADTISIESLNDGFISLPQGKGEAYFVKNGKVIFNGKAFTQNNEALLSEKISSIYA